MKLAVPRSTIVVAIVAILAFALFAGLGFIQGKTNGTTELVTESQTQTVSVPQVVTQTALTTVTTTSLSQTTDTLYSATTLMLPTTRMATTTETQSVTKYQNQTILQTYNQTITSEQTAVITLASNYLLQFTTGVHDLPVSQGSFVPGFNGFIGISYQSNQTIHWVLSGNNVNETSPSQTNGGIEFPVTAYVRYFLFVYNDDCDFAGCGTPFNATATIYYEY